MKKYLITALLFFVIFVSGCQMNKIEYQNTLEILDTTLSFDNNLTNTFMNGYEFYLPKGMKIVDKKDYNLKIEDKDRIYYLYIDTIAYHYQKQNSFKENSNHLYSKKISYNGKSGFIDVIEDNDNYFVVLMYNYAKVEAYIPKESIDDTILDICYMIRSIKYNDKVISEYIGENNILFQEERFNIFDSKTEKDNFLKYEEEYGTYKEKIDINKDNDVIEVTEVVE